MSLRFCRAHHRAAPMPAITPPFTLHYAIRYASPLAVTEDDFRHYFAWRAAYAMPIASVIISITPRRRRLFRYFDCYADIAFELMPLPCRLFHDTRAAAATILLRCRYAFRYAMPLRRLFHVRV